jgi:hypothetical protein
MSRIEEMLTKLAAGAEQAVPAPPAAVQRNSSRRGIMKQRSVEGTGISSSSSSSANVSALSAEISAAKEHLAVLKAQDAAQRRSCDTSNSQATAQQAAQNTLSKSDRGGSRSSSSRGSGKLQNFVKGITLFSSGKRAGSASLVDSQPSSNRTSPTAATTAAAAATAAAATAARSTETAAERSSNVDHVYERRGSADQQMLRGLSTIAEDAQRSIGRSSDFEFAAALAEEQEQEVLEEQQGKRLRYVYNSYCCTYVCYAPILRSSCM